MSEIRVCPRCGADNLCGMSRVPAGEIPQCWCMQEPLHDTDGSLGRVTNESDSGSGASCYCKSCLRELKNRGDVPPA